MKAQAGILLRHVRGLATAGGEVSDGQLLERFTARQEEAAFAGLVRRHGPMVLGVCRRVLRQEQDAEDAFQAAFLALARKAPSIGKRDSVGSWLYQVAYRVAVKARERAANRQKRECGATARQPADPLAEITGRELLALLDEELARLPQRQRAPLVLCYLQGLTRDAAARQLGCSERTLQRRLGEARQRLRERLGRRGLALPAALLAAGTIAAAVPPALATNSVQTALGKATEVPATVAALAREALRGAAGRTSRTAGALLLAAGLIAVTGGLLAPHTPTAAGVDPPPAKAEAPNVPPAPTDDKEMIITGRILGADGRAASRAAVVVLGAPNRLYRRNDPAASRDTILAEGKTDAEGRFRLTAPRTSSAQFRGVSVVATARKHAPAWLRLNPDAKQAEALLTLPAEQIVRGSLVDLQGAPAAGVKAAVSYVGKVVNGQPEGISRGSLPKGAPWPESVVVTDEKGAFVLRGCNRDQGLTLVAGDDRFASQSFEIDTPGKPRPGRRIVVPGADGDLQEQESGPDEKGQPEVLKLPLTAGRLVEGRITYGDTGRPAARAWFGGAQTDEDGRFRFRFAGPSGLTLEVLAPEGEPYLSVFHRLEWPKGAVRQEVNVTLPRGVLVRGKVTEAGSGQPVAGAGVQYWPRAADDPNRPRNLITGWPPAEVTKEDGTFRLAVLPGEAHLMIQGPTPEYVHAEIGSEVVSEGRPGGTRTYPDAYVRLGLPAKGEPKELAVTLRRGVTVRGKLLGPDGKPIAQALMMHRLHVGVALVWRLPERVRDGVFEVHGLDPEGSVRVYFLDAENQWGATVELSGKQAGETVTVKLAPCGQATARYVDGKGRPLAGWRIPPDIIITPGHSRETPGRRDQEGELLADKGSVMTLDRHTYDRIESDAQGHITFPALIPGATYQVNRFDGEFPAPHKEFTAESGKAVDLGDIPIKTDDE
jgi:RNA polymerase sigma factor (sigma-70 family)